MEFGTIGCAETWGLASKRSSQEKAVTAKVNSLESISRELRVKLSRSGKRKTRWDMITDIER